MIRSKPAIAFDKELAPDILKAFSKTVDCEGYLVEENTGQRVLSPEGEEILLEEFAGITKGSEIYLKSDIISLIDFAEGKWTGKKG